MQKINYRFVIAAQGVAGAAILAVGYAPLASTTGFGASLSEPAHFTSLSQTIAKAMAFNRRFQSSGVDTRVEVYGMVVDDTTNGKPAAPATPVRALVAAEAAEQVYARIDTPDQGLTQRIALANRTVGVAALIADFAEDVSDGPAP